MTREKLRQYKRNQTELDATIRAIDQFQGDLEAVEVVAGKVTKSSDDFPYIEEHMTVKMYDPKQADQIKERIMKAKKRKTELEIEIQEVEMFIDSLPEGLDKRIFELAYLKGMTQRQIGTELNRERSGISKKISERLKLSHKSHF